MARNPREMGDALHRTGNNLEIHKPLVSREFCRTGNAHHYDMIVRNSGRQRRENGLIQRTDRH